MLKHMMNPARSLGPALVSGIWTEQWIYVFAPLVGAAIGATIYQLLREPAATSSRNSNENAA